MPFLRDCHAAGHFRCMLWTDCILLLFSFHVFVSTAACGSDFATNRSVVHRPSAGAVSAAALTVVVRSASLMCGAHARSVAAARRALLAILCA